jgi:hypothetical protein
MERLRRFYEQRAPDMILATMQLPSPTLKEFAASHAIGFCGYPDPHERARFWDALCREKMAVHDDSVPSGYLTEMDQGLYGGAVGGKARFLCDTDTGWISSMVEPILRDWSEFDRLAALEVDEANNPWLQRYLLQLDVFRAAAHGKWGVSHFILIDGLNFAFELVGATETYLATIDRPAVVRRVIDVAFKVNCKVQDMFFERVPLLKGGTCSNFAQWIPGRIVSESLDPFHMTSVDYFEEWGREPVERILAHFDGGVIHIHGNGRHLLKAAATLKGLKAILLADDRGFPAAFDILPAARQQVGDMPLIVYNVEFEKFRKALEEHQLTGGVLYTVKNVPDADAANRWMDRVRAFKP